MAIQVAVRGRPLLSDDEDSGRTRCATIEQGGAVQVGRSPADANHLVARACPRFVFDGGFNETSTQDEVFDWVIPAIDCCFEGYNGSIMAYGQTGSGKTYTMGTSSTALMNDPEQHGIVPRAFARIAAEIQRRTQDNEAEIELRMSFVEVHDDSVKDLLADPGSTGEIMIREDARGEVVLVGANEVEVSPPTCGDMMRLLEQGSLARTTAATLMNATSSRSHAVLTVLIEQWLKPSSPARQRGMPERVKAKLQLVDLAGSERNKRAQTTGRHFKESVNINQGLLALANCINVLSDDTHARPGAPGPHVPYRDHKLTRLLRNSLGGNARTFILACVSTAPANFQETVSTLRYAARVRNHLSNLISQFISAPFRWFFVPPRVSQTGCALYNLCNTGAEHPQHAGGQRRRDLHRGRAARGHLTHGARDGADAPRARWWRRRRRRRWRQWQA
eukprot:COSAG05_NODE_1303_length_5240_cov_2.158335_2_plen_448_part_00